MIRRLLILLLLMLAVAGKAHGQSFAYINEYYNGSNNTIYTFNDAGNLGTPAADRHIIVNAFTRSAGNPVVSSITVNGVAATIVNNVNDGDASVAQAIAAVPTGTAGDIVVTWDDSVGRCEITVYEATGLASATPTDTDSASVTDPSVVLTKAAGITIGAAACDSSTASVAWTGLSEDADGVAESACHFTSASEESTAGNDTISITYTNGDADTAFAVATWAYAVTEAAYASPTLRKSLHMAADGGAWNWQRAFVQDAAVLSNPVEAGDIIVRRESDGLQVPAIVTQNDADGIDVNVLLPLTLRSTYEQYYLDVATAGTAAASSWPSFGVRQAAPTSGIDGAYTVYTGEDETGSSTSSAEFVHPFVVKVPSGSWASHLDSNLNGEVTHLIADTPYPGSNADYENPVLFYSTDNCATRARVPSTSIPWPLDGVPASGSNKDVCAFFLPESGDLIVSWKNPVDEAKFARISGTHLTDAAVDSEWSNAAVNADVGSEFIVANSYIALSDNRVRAFFTSPAPNDTDGCGSIYYRDTTNFLDGAAATWTTEQQVSLAGGELDRGWWHGGICHNGIGGPLHDGYYYLVYSEGKAGQVATFDSDDLGSHARLFRSRSIDGPWEPALDVLIEHGGASTVSEEGIYQIAISEDAAGKPFAVCSMRDASGDYAVGRTAVDLRRTLVPTATAYNQGWGSSSVYATASPLLAAVDFQRDTLSDASGNGNDATLTGSPTQTEGVGVVLDGSTQYITLGSSDLLGGESFVDMGGLFTFPSTFATGASQGVLCDDNPGAGGSFEYGFRFWVDPSTGKVTDFFWHNGTTAQGNSTEVGPDLRGGTHFIRVLYDAANGDAKLWIDGATYQTVTVTGSLRSNAAKRVRIGCDGGGSNFLDCTCHYFYIRTGGGPDYALYRGGRGYALPAAETTTPKPLQQFPVFGR